MEQNPSDSLNQELMRAPLKASLSENLDALKSLMNAALNKDCLLYTSRCV